MWTLSNVSRNALFAMKRGYSKAEYFDKESLINSLPTIRFNSDTIPNWVSENVMIPMSKRKSEP
jgi:hypothetical protein